MAYQFQSIREHGPFRGVDTLSAESAIPEGYVELAENVELALSGGMAKRRGYQGYYGYMPMRVTQIAQLNQADNNLQFTLASGIDVSRIPSRPIVVYGRLSAAQSSGGDWTSATADNAEYYTAFTTSVHHTLTATSGTKTILDSVHGITTTSNVFMQVFERTDSSRLDNRVVLTDRVDIAYSSTYDVDITYNTPIDMNVYFGIADHSTTSGVDYTSADRVIVANDTFVDANVTVATNNINTVSHGLYTGDKVQLTTSGTLPAGLSLATDYYIIRVDADNYKFATSEANAIAGTAVDITAAAGGGTHTVTVYRGYLSLVAGTHGLANYNIIPQFYIKDTGAGEYYQYYPDSCDVNTSTGEVVIRTVTNGTATTIRAILSAASSANVETLSIVAASSDSFEVDADGEAFHFCAVYTNSAGILSLVIPDSISYDEDTDILTISMTNNTTSTIPFVLYYEPVTISSNVLVVTANSAVSGAYTDTAPQLTIWGIPHDGVYTSETDGLTSFPGWVSDINAYTASGESYLTAAFGGNLFFTGTRTTYGSSYLIPSTTLAMSATIADTVTLQPLFVLTGATASRTHGNVVADNIDSNKAVVTAVSYVSSGVTRYTLSLTNKVGTLASISTTTQQEDYLTVTGMAHPEHNGTFKITAVDNSANTITVANSAVIIADLDETGANGRAGVFSDWIHMSADVIFQVGDVFETALFPSFTPSVKRVNGTYVTINGITTEAYLPAGDAIYATRETDVIPVASTSNFVVGDMISIAGYDQEFRVLGVNSSSDVSITSITVSGTTATVTTGAAHGFVTGLKVAIIRQAVDAYNTEAVVTSIINSTSFTFTTTDTTGSAGGGIIRGQTLYIDTEIEVSDNFANTTTVSVVGRWLPIEAPTSADNLPKPTYVQHFDVNAAIAQPRLRSALVADALYYTNDADEVMKYDGSYVYRAGLPRWQPALFVQLDTGTGTIPASDIYADGTDTPPNRFTPTNGPDANMFKAGDVVVDDAGNYLVVQSSKVDGTTGHVYTVGAVSGSATRITKVARRLYYFRLNAIDNNNNVVISAVTGMSDFAVDITTDCQVKMRLVGLPVWDNYDYDKLELEVYATKAQTPGPYYRVGVVDMTFNTKEGYIDFTDVTTDDFLLESDTYVTELKGAELATAISSPLRAKAIAAKNNRLLLGNIKDFPELDIVLRSTTSSTAVTAANMAGKIWKFRKDATNTGTTTNMVDRAFYEWVNSGAVTIVPNTDIATTSTTFTVTEAGHGLVAGNWVYMFHAAVGAVNNLTFAGWWQIASADTNTFTVNFSGHGLGSGGGTANDVDRYVAATTKTDIPVWLGTDGNRNMYGANTVNEFTAMLRLSEAINASMRLADTAVSGQSTFVPWMMAHAGSSFGVGQLIVRQEKVLTTTMEVVTPAAITGANFYVNGLKKSAATDVSAVTKSFPSRVLISYPQYPEIFDAPAAASAQYSDSIVDINIADGDEIQAITSFFGHSATSGSQVEDVVVVFKQHSIYVLNVTTREYAKLDSNGLGCTAPDSVAAAAGGIIFANNSGVFQLGRDYTITKVGETIQTLYDDNVNKDMLQLLAGHYYGVGKTYRLAVPYDGATQYNNNSVLVLADQKGWTRDTGYEAVCWATLDNSEFFGTPDGQIFVNRQLGQDSDFRDDAAAITMTIIFRGMHFGSPGVRKLVSSVVAHFRMRHTSITALSASVSADLDGVFSSIGTIELDKDASNKIESVLLSLSRKKCQYLQIKLQDATIDEEVIVTGLDFNVTLLNDKGIQQQES